MKTFVRHAAMLLAVAALCQARTAVAEDFHWVSGGGTAATLVGDEKPAAEQTPGSSCGQVACCDPCCDPSCDACCDPCAGMMGCDECPRRGIVGFAGFDSFKGVSDGAFVSNFGVVSGLNSALALGDSGVNWQLGMSYGVYDFDGRTTFNQATSQQQIFVTTGFFHKAREDRRLSFGIVYDWMLNDNWGVFATTPTLGQWRGQAEYALSGCNAVGVYGCIRDLFSQQNLHNAVITTRGVSQVNLFWHHKFVDTAADTWVWVGGVQNDRLSGQGSLGDWVVGASGQMPLSDRLALYGNAQYMHPSEAAGVVATAESSWNVGFGLVWYFGGHARCEQINGKCNLPYMPVANNSTFLVDQNAVAP